LKGERLVGGNRGWDEPDKMRHRIPRPRYALIAPRLSSRDALEDLFVPPKPRANVKALDATSSSRERAWRKAIVDASRP
jgi:hypothetical protein